MSRLGLIMEKEFPTNAWDGVCFGIAVSTVRVWHLHGKFAVETITRWSTRKPIVDLSKFQSMKKAINFAKGLTS